MKRALLGIVLGLLACATLVESEEVLFPPVGGGGVTTTVPFPLTIGGTGQDGTSFTAGDCVQVAANGLSLESSGDPCGTGSGSSPVPTQTPWSCGAGNGARGMGSTPECFTVPTPDGAGAGAQPTQTAHDCGSGNYQQGHNSTPICVVAPTPDGNAGAPTAGTYIDVSGQQVSVDLTEVADATIGDNSEASLDLTVATSGSNDIAMQFSDSTLGLASTGNPALTLDDTDITNGVTNDTRLAVSCAAGPACTTALSHRVTGGSEILISGAGDATGITMGSAGLTGAITLATNGTGDSEVVLPDASVGATELGTDSVSADELNATGVESELEAVLDLQDLQGAVTDGQVPNTITVDLATTATTANAGDSATSFFSSGTIEAARLPDADDDATTKGVATFSNSQFDATSGSVTIATGGIGATELSSTTGSEADTCVNCSLSIDADGRIRSASDGTDIDATDIYVSKTGTDSATCGAVFDPCLTITGANGAHAKIPDPGGVTCDADFEQGCMRCANGATASPSCGSMDDCSANQPCSFYTCSDDSTRACAFQCSTTTSTKCTIDAHCPIGETCNTAGADDCAGAATCTNLAQNSRCSGHGGFELCAGQSHTYRVVLGQGTWSECLDDTDHPKSWTIYTGAGRQNTIIQCASGSHEVTDTDQTKFVSLSLISENAAALRSTGATTGLVYTNGNTGNSSTHTQAEPAVKFTGRGNLSNEFTDVWFNSGYAGTGPGCFSFEAWPNYVCTNDETVSCATLGASPCTGGAGTCTDRTCYDEATNLRSNACATTADCSGSAICIPIRRLYEGWPRSTTASGSADLWLKDSLLQCSGMDNNVAVDLRGKAGGSDLNIRVWNNLFYLSEKATSAKVCQGGANDGAACTVDSQCPSSTCATTSRGSTYDMRVRRIDGSGSNLKVSMNGNVFVSDAASGLFPPTDTDVSVEANTTVLDQGGNFYDSARRSIAGTLTYASGNVAGGGSSWRGTLINDPVNPQDGECWTLLAATDLLKCRLDGVTYTIPTLTRPETLTNKTLTSPTLTTPTIADFTSATHNHTNAAGGGLLTTYQLKAGESGAQTLALSTNNNGALTLGGGNGTGTITLGAGTGSGTIHGGSGTGEDLTLSSTSNGTKGAIKFGTGQYDEANDRFQIGAQNCSSPGNAAACVTGSLTVSAPGDSLSNAVVTRTATQTLTNKSIDAGQLTGTIANARLDSTAAAFLRDGGTTDLTCGSSNQGKAQVMDDGTVQVCDGASTSLRRVVGSNLVTFSVIGNGTVNLGGTGYTGAHQTFNGSYLGGPILTQPGVLRNFRCRRFTAIPSGASNLEELFLNGATTTQTCGFIAAGDCTGSGTPVPCCTGSGAGATCSTTTCTTSGAAVTVAAGDDVVVKNTVAGGSPGVSSLSCSADYLMTK